MASDSAADGADDVDAVGQAAGLVVGVLMTRSITVADVLELAASDLTCDWVGVVVWLSVAAAGVLTALLW